MEIYWGILKQKIKSTYNVIPSKNIIHFIKEAEYKYNIRDKDFDTKIKDFFECFKLLENISNTIIPKTEFLKDSISNTIIPKTEFLKDSDFDRGSESSED